MRLVRYIPLLLLFLLLIIVFLSFFSMQGATPKISIIEQNISSQQPNEQPECSPGQTKTCFTQNNCSGKSYCSESRWSPCVINKVCIPGSTIGCYIDECRSGIKVCNRCGTAYGDCISRTAS